MNKFDKNFHMNFSPFYLTVVFMIIVAFAFETTAEDKAVGYTTDGLPVTFEDLSAEARQELLEKEMAEADDLVEEATSTKPVLVTATTSDGRTVNYSCRVVNINKVNEE